MHENFEKYSKKPVTLECKEFAGIIMGKFDMLQRALKELRSTLQSCNVTLPSYKAIFSKIHETNGKL